VPCWPKAASLHPRCQSHGSRFRLRTLMHGPHVRFRDTDGVFSRLHRIERPLSIGAACFAKLNHRFLFFNHHSFAGVFLAPDAIAPVPSDDVLLSQNERRKKKRSCHQRATEILTIPSSCHLQAQIRRTTMTIQRGPRSDAFSATEDRSTQPPTGAQRSGLMGFLKSGLDQRQVNVNGRRLIPQARSQQGGLGGSSGKQDSAIVNRVTPQV